MKHQEQLNVETQSALKWKEVTWVLCLNLDVEETREN